LGMCACANVLPNKYVLYLNAAFTTPLV